VIAAAMRCCNCTETADGAHQRLVEAAGEEAAVVAAVTLVPLEVGKNHTSLEYC
jgi:hypothetical protein